MTVSMQEFLSLRSQLPVIDVRSEKEFGEGHISKAVNIPLLNNEERIAVGTDYKKKGQLEAIKTGFRLVGPRIIDIVTQAESVAPAKEILVHCWRGGMRSSNFCHFVEMAKMRTHQLKGGYKAYRHEALASFGLPFQFIVIGGMTGSGKTEILRALEQLGEQVIDLEKLASHKGSVFGGLLMPPQPTTEQFQNDLFEKILSLDLNRRIWIEDESIAVGKIFLPEPLWRSMSMASLMEINVDRQTRIERLVCEYGSADKNSFLLAMEKITKKLGGQHFKAARQAVLEGDMNTSIEILLHYYDKAYTTGLSKKQDRIKYKFNWKGADSKSFANKLLDEIGRHIW
jgi:tRNA 2-selenouridine synthase